MIKRKLYKIIATAVLIRLYQFLFFKTYYTTNHIYLQKKTQSMFRLSLKHWYAQLLIQYFHHFYLIFPVYRLTVDPILVFGQMQIIHRMNNRPHKLQQR